MNRTLALFGAAGALAALALFVSPRAWVRPPHPVPHPPPTQEGTLTLSARFSHPLLAPGATDAFLTLDVRGPEQAAGARRPVQLALVIDRSGSMGGEKLQNAKAAARQLVSQLGSQDALALIDYGSDVQVLPSQPMTPANKEAVLAAVDRIEDAGGTNIGDALTEAGKALAVASEGSMRRVILVSDGQPTEGETDARVLAQQARTLHQQGIGVSAIGVGTDFNEDLMHALAELGAGSYGYLRDTAQLAGLFTRDLQQASTRVAQNVELTVDLPPGVALKDALGYRSTQDGNRVHIPLPDFSPQQLERVVVALAVQAPGAGAQFPVASVNLTYDDLVKKGPALAQARLSAEVTEQLAEVEARQDKDVAVTAARAQTAANVMRAADLLSAGKAGEAQAVLSNNAPLLQKAERIAGPGAMADDKEANKEMVRGFATSSAAGGDSLAHEVKAAKRKALLDFGHVGSVY